MQSRADAARADTYADCCAVWAAACDRWERDRTVVRPERAAVVDARIARVQALIAGERQIGDCVAHGGLQRDGDTLTTDKRPCPTQSLSAVNNVLAAGFSRRTLALRWLALLMELSPDISRYAHEFKQAVLLCGGHEDEAAQHGDLAEVAHLNDRQLILSYVPQECRRINESDFCDFA